MNEDRWAWKIPTRGKYYRKQSLLLSTYVIVISKCRICSIYCNSQASPATCRKMVLSDAMTWCAQPWVGQDWPKREVHPHERAMIWIAWKRKKAKNSACSTPAEKIMKLRPPSTSNMFGFQQSWVAPQCLCEFFLRNDKIFPTGTLVLTRKFLICENCVTILENVAHILKSPQRRDWFDGWPKEKLLEKFVSARSNFEKLNCRALLKARHPQP